MFTGIIETTGRLIRRTPHGDDQTLTIESQNFNFSHTQLGDSIAVNGVCLTVTELSQSAFSADVSAETLRLTTLGQLREGSIVNLESALMLQTPLGGHLVSGHVDGVGILEAREPEARSEKLTFRMPKALARYVAQKGSITIDGISLTVNHVSDEHFSVNIIPHTNERTTLSHYAVGQEVNLEVDVIARYLERLLQSQNESALSQGLTLEQLKQAGF
ncbi:MAG: riboflavin synthase [Cardiobacteriaceae bacterium]|nr:riboflavin synthase [Cardiobacteriaceae bacterium]